MVYLITLKVTTQLSFTHEGTKEEAEQEANSVVEEMLRDRGEVANVEIQILNLEGK